MQATIYNTSMEQTPKLYPSISFKLPEFPSLKFSSFCSSPLVEATIEAQFPRSQLPILPTYSSSYTQTFEQLVAHHNIYPIFFDRHADQMVICSKDSFILVNSKQNSQQSCDIYPLKQAPTAVKLGKLNILLGFQSGAITLFDLAKREFLSTVEEFSQPVTQVEIYRQKQKEITVIAIDSGGNLREIEFSHRTFMEKIIKTTSSSNDISVISKIKKREKIKSMFKSLISAKSDNLSGDNLDTQTSSGENFNAPEKIPYCYSRFALLSQQDNAQIAVFRQNTLSVVTINAKFQNINQEILLKDPSVDQLAGLGFGEGGFANANSKYQLLLAAHQRTIHLFKVLRVQDGHTEFILVSSIPIEWPLIDVQFLSNNLLVLISEAGVHLTNVNEAVDGIIASYDQSKFGYIDFFNTEEQFSIDKEIVLGSVIKCEQTEGSHFAVAWCLQGKRLLAIRVESWMTYIKRIEEIGDPSAALRVSLAIYSGQIKKLANIDENQTDRNKKMSETFSSICKNLIEKFQSSPQKIKVILNDVIYFLLQTDNSHILFTEIYKFAREKNLTATIDEALQPYIGHSQLRITYLPEVIFEAVILKFKANGRKDKLEKLIMGFDLQAMEVLSLLTVCLREELFESLISICCTRKDYITPIFKLCGIVLQKGEKTEHIREIIYYYLTSCFAGKMTPYGDQDAYIFMLQALINFLFIPSSLEMLLQIWPAACMSVLNELFSPNIIRLLLQNQDKFFIRKSQYVNLSIFEQDRISELRHYEKMLATLISVGEKLSKTDEPRSKEYMNETYKFLAFVMLKNQFPFLRKYKEDVLRFLIGNPFIFDPKKSLGVPSDLMILEINARLIRLIEANLKSLRQRELLEGEQKDGREQMLLGIESWLKISQFSELYLQSRCYINHELRNYRQTLALFLRMRSKAIRLKIFTYLEHNLSGNPSLTEEFVNCFSDLLKINEEKCVELLKLLQEVDYESVLAKLADYALLQLRFIQDVVNRMHSQNLVRQEMPRGLLLAHLQTVVKCKLPLEEYIYRMDYPLEQAYKLCEEVGSRPGKAYILIKSGKNLEGVLMLTELFLESCDEAVKVLARKKVLEPEKYINLHKQLDIVLETSSKEYSLDPQRGEEIWEKCVEIIFKRLQISNMDSPSIPVLIKGLLDSIITKMLGRMFQQVSPEFFITKFIKNFSNLPFNVFLASYTHVFSRLEFKFQLQRLAKDLLQSQELSLASAMWSARLQGNACRSLCSSCNRSIQAGLILSFHCGHVFHEGCLTESRPSKNSPLCSKCFTLIQGFLAGRKKSCETVRGKVSCVDPKREYIETRAKEFQRNTSRVLDWS